SELSGLGGSLNRVRAAEPNAPVRRNFSRWGGHGPSDRGAIQVEHGVFAHALHGLCARLPTEHLPVELNDPGGVRRQDFIPDERAVLVDQPSALMATGLPQPKRCPAGIYEEGHAAGVRDVGRRHRELTAGSHCLGHGLVDAVDVDVGIPHGRYVLGGHLRWLTGEPRNELALERGHPVRAEAGHFVAYPFPSEQLAIERLGFLYVCRRKIDPRGDAVGISVACWHFATPILKVQLGNGSVATASCARLEHSNVNIRPSPEGFIPQTNAARRTGCAAVRLRPTAHGSLSNGRHRQAERRAAYRGGNRATHLHEFMT